MTLSNDSVSKLKNLGVKIVYLFGSRAAGTALENSDYDLGVVFSDGGRTLTDSHTLFTDIYRILSNDFPDQIKGPKPDISFLQRANAALEMTAVLEGIVLFEDDPVFRADYEESVVKRYDDYLPLKRKYEEVTFSAFTK
ncbi:MAG: nucleotidyltransferase domain-containing protein [Candidatus Taylorbacteria bacterium]|nr:nucleotidyltransferase domain-containing protein [Candidatus Taylorbacteria bacterium]